MKEKILEVFSNLGFKLEEGEMSYSFTYEGLNMLYLYNESDEEFLSIALPGIMKLEDGNTLQICALMERINSSLKYIKAYIINDSVWLFYERERLEHEDLTAIIPRMIFHLEAGMEIARKTMDEIEKSMTDDYGSSEENGNDTEETDTEETDNDKE